MQFRKEKHKVATSNKSISLTGSIMVQMVGFKL